MSGRTNARQGKPPAFQFYAADWLTSQSTRCMTHAERGAYIDLLAYAWRDGSIPEDPDLLARLLGTDPITLRNWWVAIGPCWQPLRGKAGRLVNRRMEDERKQLHSYRKAMSEAGKRGAAKRWHPQEIDGAPDGQAMTTPMASGSTASATASASATNAHSITGDVGGAGGEPGAAPQTPPTRGAPWVLEQLNRRREQLKLRTLKPTASNLRPIRSRLRDGHTAKDLALAAYGASMDPWVMEHMKLVPSHVYRPSNVEQYIDAANAAQVRQGNGKPKAPTTRVESIPCTKCERYWAQTLPVDAPAPTDFVCTACQELPPPRQRGDGGLAKLGT